MCNKKARRKNGKAKLALYYSLYKKISTFALAKILNNRIANLMHKNYAYSC